MYEQPSMHMELARLKHKDYVAEAERARLAAHVRRTPSERLELLKSAAAGLRSALARRRPVIVAEPRFNAAG